MVVYRLFSYGSRVDNVNNSSNNRGEGLDKSENRTAVQLQLKLFLKQFFICTPISK